MTIAATLRRTRRPNRVARLLATGAAVMLGAGTLVAGVGAGPAQAYNGGASKTSPVALPITPPGSFTGNNTGLTTAGWSCSNGSGQCAEAATYWSWTPASSGTATVDTCGGATWDTMIDVWTGASAATFVTYSDDDCGFRQSRVTFTYAAGSTYVIGFGGYNKATGSATINMQVTATNSAPANTVPPAVSGTAMVGQTLTSTAGTWSGSPSPTIAYQWQSCSTADCLGGVVTNVGANQNTYQLTAAELGKYTRVVATATNGMNPPAVANSNITSAVVEVPAVTTTALGGGTPGVAYSESLSASGGKLPLTWSVSVGSLPDGLALDPPTGAITGTPTTPGLSTFTVMATDSSTPGVSATKSLSIKIDTPVITTGMLPVGTQDTAGYSAAVTADGGDLPHSFAVTGGSLPTGLSMAADGTITGTPTAAGTASFTVTVTDSLLPTPRTSSSTLSIDVSAPPSVTTASLPGGTVGGPDYGQALAAADGTAPLAWTLTGGSLPTGLALAADGSITGTPSASGTFPFTVTVTDANGATASKALSITITGALSVTTASLPNSTVGGPAYNQALTAAGGVAPRTWMVEAGTLPGGLAMSAAGQITGSPFSLGTFTFTARVTDGNGATASKELTISVVQSAPPTVQTLLATSITRTGAALNGRVNANGSAADVSFEYSRYSSFPSAYTTVVPARVPTVTGNTPASANRSVTGLLPNTKYWFRAVANNGGGFGQGNTISFTTLN